MAMSISAIGSELTETLTSHSKIQTWPTPPWQSSAYNESSPWRFLLNLRETWGQECNWVLECKVAVAKSFVLMTLEQICSKNRRFLPPKRTFTYFTMSIAIMHQTASFKLVQYTWELLVPSNGVFFRHLMHTGRPKARIDTKWFPDYTHP